MRDPYRMAGERELPTPPPKEEFPLGLVVFLSIVAIIIVCVVVMAIDGNNRMESRFAFKEIDHILMLKRRANTCGFEDVDKGFKIVSYDGHGNERNEGFFSTRQEADKFKDNLDRCKSK